MTIQEAMENIGKLVVRRQAHLPEIAKYGVITGINNTHVLVRYNNSVGSIATDPIELNLLKEHLLHKGLQTGIDYW